MAAELVSGAMLSVSLQFLCERLVSEEISQLFQGKKPIRKLLDKLNTGMLSANAVLNDAEDKQLLHDNVNNWLFRLQDIIYQADDLVDMMDYEALRSKLKDHKQSSSLATKAFHQLKSMTHLLSTFDKIVQHDVTEILGKLDDLLAQKDALGLRQDVQNNYSQRPPAPLPERIDVYGRDAEIEAIVDLLLKDNVDGGNNISVIPIFGMAGAGKTTLVRRVYDNDRVIRYFDVRVWVIVSYEFDISRIIREIFERVTCEKCDIESPEEIRRLFMGKRFMLVFDDVWNESYHLWDSLKSCFDCGANGSKILMTTRSKIVAFTMTSGPVHHLQTLSNEACWQLFVKHAFGHNNDLSNRHKDLEVPGRKIVDKCKGHPLAIKSLGGLLRSERNVKKWEDILDSDIWEELKGSILPTLWLSYRHLPPRLKQCFAYCSIFPKDYQFGRKELILLWMAQGFLPLDNESKKMEEYGEEYLEDLLSKSLFQDSNKGKSFLQMHDLVHDLAKFVSKNFSFRLDTSNDLLNFPTKTRHLSCMKGRYDTDKVRGLREAKSLRTFLTLPFQQQCNTWSLVQYDCMFTSGSCLRVLVLNEFAIKVLPDSIGNLVHLRYLDLSFTEIEELPNTILKLYFLQTLLLEGCTGLATLPRKIASLVNLRHLHNPPFLKETPLIGNMTSLRTLNGFFMDGKNTKSCMKQLQGLENLHGTLHIPGLENVDHKDALEAELKNKKSLDKLILRWDTNHAADYLKSQEEKQVLGQLEPHANLKELEIHSYKGTRFPDWFGSNLLNMVTVSLYKCKSCSILPSLGQLPSLKHLMISDFPSLTEIGTEVFSINSDIKPFRCLESLHVESMPKLQKWLFVEDELEGGVFPCLEELELKDCPRLKVSLPDYMPSLRKLVIDECDQLLPLLPTAAFPLLDTITISECHGQEVFLQGGLPSTLKEIVICSCENLRALDSEAIQHLTSLEKLEISFCDNVGVLPELPTSLCSLTINYCPLLTPLLQRETGEDWHKIAHIPNIEMRSLPYGL